MARKIECDRCGTQARITGTERPRGWCSLILDRSPLASNEIECCERCSMAALKFMERRADAKAVA